MVQEINNKPLLGLIVLFSVICLSYQQGLNYIDQQTWGGLCITGQFQSPIDIPPKAEMIPSDTIFSIKYDKYALIDNEILTFYHNYKYMINAKGTNSSLYVTYNDIEYQYDLLEIHFHFRSEHTVQSNPLDIEMHMVHRKNAAYISHLASDPDAKNQFLVVGIMFRVDNVADNPFISLLNFDSKLPVNNVDLKPFVDSQKPYYYYQGSFTTPQCNEIVHWIVMEKVELISLMQNQAIMRWIGEVYPSGNARITYPLNGRNIYYVNSDKQLSNKVETNPNNGETMNFSVAIGISLGFIFATLFIIAGFIKQ